MKDPTNNEKRMHRLITLVRAVPPVFRCCQGLDAGLIKAVGGGGPEMQPLLTTCGPLGRARPLRIHYRGLTHTDVVARLLALPLHPQDQPTRQEETEKAASARRPRSTRQPAIISRSIGGDFKNRSSAVNSRERRRHRAKGDRWLQPKGEQSNKWMFRFIGSIFRFLFCFFGFVCLPLQSWHFRNRS